jgi:hypothetical protein
MLKYIRINARDMRTILREIKATTVLVAKAESMRECLKELGVNGWSNGKGFFMKKVAV